MRKLRNPRKDYSANNPEKETQSRVNYVVTHEDEVLNSYQSYNAQNRKLSHKLRKYACFGKLSDQNLIEVDSNIQDICAMKIHTSVHIVMEHFLKKKEAVRCGVAVVEFSNGLLERSLLLKKVANSMTMNSSSNTSEDTITHLHFRHLERRGNSRIPVDSTL